MIQVRDAMVLAYTKLRTHRVRTGLTVGIAGIMFGLMLAVIFVVQGVFDSVERFDEQGLSDRAILAIGQFNASTVDPASLSTDQAFIAEVKALRDAAVQKKKAAAEKFRIPYHPDTEDPNPIAIDPVTKQRGIADDQLGSAFVVAAAQARSAKNGATSFDLAAYLAPYPSARILPEYRHLVDHEGAVIPYMPNGKEIFNADQHSGDLYSKDRNDASAAAVQAPSSLTIIDAAVTDSFITSSSFEPEKGELPIILPYSDAVMLLGLKPLGTKASNDDKLKQLQEVRRRIGEVQVSFCYRNEASQQMVSAAIQQKAERKQNEKNPDYALPSMVYALPTAESCGQVTVEKDTRTAEEKQADSSREAYEKEIGTHLGKPVQHKLTLRGVGVSSEMDASEMTIGVGAMIQGLLGSTLGYDSWVIPAGLLEKTPESVQPAELFHPKQDTSMIRGATWFSMDEHLVEFSDKDDARAVLKATQASFDSDNEQPAAMASQFGSSSLLVDETKKIMTKAVLWGLGLVGGIAMIIMASMIGRTVSEGRRESAVFRAIGAKRSDIGGIYGAYALLLSLRVVVFALVLGVTLALVVELLYWQDATVGAHLAYMIAEPSLEFHLFSMKTWMVGLVISVMVVVGLLASVIPIIRSVRRSPIADMRDDT